MSGDDETRLPAGLPGAGPRQAMSLPHNIRPEQMVGPETPGARWKRFQPLKKLQRMFRRKSKTKEGEEDYPEAPKSLSASQLPPAGRRRPSRHASPPLQSRLSMSHDSIFQSEGGGGGQGAEMGSALSIPSASGVSGRLTAELRGVLLKRRADDSDDDPGLPHSPASPSSPPAASRHQTELKGQSGKSAGSCSDGSLLSMYSSGTCTDDDIFGPLSKHPSRASLGRDPEGLELETTAALSHSAAKHRIAVRPRRNHGAPRQRRPRAAPPSGAAATGLPPTVEEESPPSTPAYKPAVPDRPAGDYADQLATDRPHRAPSGSPGRSQSIRAGSPEGATAATVTAVSVRPSHVKRSKSSVADGRIRDVSPRKLWSRDPPPAPGAAEADDRRTEKAETFFSRIFGSRRSGRKKNDRSLSPETVAEPVPVPAWRPSVARHRPQFGGDHRGSPASALHADIIRPPPSEAGRAALLAEPQPGELPSTAELPRGADLLRPSEAPRSAEWSRPTEPVRAVAELPRAVSEVPRAASEVPRPPPEALRRGPAFLADVRAEVAALAAGGDRGEDSVTVSPQVVRRHRVSAAAAVGRGSDSPRARPRLVGLTAYQQRVAHLQRSEASPETPAGRRSLSCENVSEEEPAGSRPCSGMALGSVLSLIKSTSAAAERHFSPEESDQVRTCTEQPDVPGRTAGRRESSGSPGAGPKSLDSSLLSSAAAEPPPPKASSEESVQSGGQESVPEFLRIQLHRVDGRQRDSVSPASGGSPLPSPTDEPRPSSPQRRPSAPEQRPSSPQRRPSAPEQRPSVPEQRPSAPEQRPSAPEQRPSASERRPAGQQAVPSPPVSESPPQLRRPGSPGLRRRPSQARSRGSCEAEPVILRNKPAPSSEDSELLKVFKRRSLKSRDSDELPAEVAPAAAQRETRDETETGRRRDGDGTETGRRRDGDGKENEQPREETEETVVCVSVPASPPRRPPSEDGEPRRVSVSRRDSEAAWRLSGAEEETSRPPGWLKQAVRERREQREQREQKHLVRPTQKELLIESESGPPGRPAGPSRSSRVLEMANTFQKLQTT